MVTDFKTFKKGQFFRIDVLHNNGHGNFTETIFAEFESANFNDQRPDYLEYILINQIIGIEKYIKKIDGWTLTPRSIDRYVLSKAETNFFNINDQL